MHLSFHVFSMKLHIIHSAGRGTSLPEQICSTQRASAGARTTFGAAWQALAGRMPCLCCTPHSSFLFVRRSSACCYYRRFSMYCVGTNLNTVAKCLNDLRHLTPSQVPGTCVCHRDSAVRHAQLFHGMVEMQDAPVVAFDDTVSKDLHLKLQPRRLKP